MKIYIFLRLEVATSGNEYWLAEIYSAGRENCKQNIGIIFEKETSSSFPLRQFTWGPPL